MEMVGKTQRLQELLRQRLTEASAQAGMQRNRLVVRHEGLAEDKGR